MLAIQILYPSPALCLRDLEERGDSDNSDNAGCTQWENTPPAPVSPPFWHPNIPHYTYCESAPNSDLRVGGGTLESGNYLSHLFPQEAATSSALVGDFIRGRGGNELELSFSSNLESSESLGF